MSVERLLQQLVAIPSYVDETHDEHAVADFIISQLQMLSYVSIERQEVSTGRYNVIARTKGEPRLLIAGHMDTVCPKSGWDTDQLKCTEKDGKTFGLGVVDTKGGIAALITTLTKFQSVEGLTAMFYCDEEYNFAGMRRYLSEGDAAQHKLAVVIEPTGTQLWNAHRGLIEIKIVVRGKSGHAANPASGVNAVDAMQKIFSVVRETLADYSTDALGATSMNIAGVRGGTFRGVGESGDPLLAVQGNNIPDYAEAVIDIRPAHPDLRAALLEKIVHAAAEKEGAVVESFVIVHDLGALHTAQHDLADVEKIVEQITGSASYIDATKKGYGDGQLISESAHIPVVYIGPTGGNAHGANEWIETPSLETVAAIYEGIIKKYCLTQ